MQLPPRFLVNFSISCVTHSVFQGPIERPQSTLHYLQPSFCHDLRLNIPSCSTDLPLEQFVFWSTEFGEARSSHNIFTSKHLAVDRTIRNENCLIEIRLGAPIYTRGEWATGTLDLTLIE